MIYSARITSGSYEGDQTELYNGYVVAETLDDATEQFKERVNAMCLESVEDAGCVQDANVYLLDEVWSLEGSDTGAVVLYVSEI